MALPQSIFSLLVISACLGFCHAKNYQGSTNASVAGVFRSTIYTYHPQPKTFLEAVEHCALQTGGLLASIGDAEEKQAVTDLIQRAPELADDWAYKWTWIGGYKTHAGWLWLNSENKIDSSLWGPNRPIGKENDIRLCTSLWRGNRTSEWQLIDNYCDGVFPFVCAK